METRIAKVISYLFHPVVVPLYLMFIILHLNNFHVYLIPENVKWLMIGMLALATIAFPILFMILMVRRGLIQDINLERREERLYPYILVAIMYYAMYLLFSSVHLPSIVSNLLLGIFILVILALLINLWWKISIHMTGMGGITGTFLGITIRYLINMQMLIVAAIFLAGWVGYSRLKLNSHKSSEVYSGFIMGVIVMLLLYILN
jgi:hypothetical protein